MFGTYAIVTIVIYVVFAVLIATALILLIRFLLAGTRAAQLYVDTQRPPTPPKD